MGTEDEILERVDEYTLYCFYLGFSPDLYMKYTSPIPAEYRDGGDDSSPSFGIFRATRIQNREFGWKDQGGKGLSGDIFNLVKLIYGYRNKEDAVRRIASDFGFGEKVVNVPKIVGRVPVPAEPTRITSTYRKFQDWDFKWWRTFNISRGILEHYRVRPISCYWTYESQREPRFPEKGMGYEYKVSTRKQLYFPLAKKEFKFRNDLTDKDLMGFDQLWYKTDTLVITKSYKDVMCLRSFQFDAVCPQGESVLVSREHLDYLQTRYSNIFILFDNDGKHKADSYPFPQRFIPLDSGQKDITDFCVKYGIPATQALLEQLIR